MDSEKFQRVVNRFAWMVLGIILGMLLCAALGHAQTAPAGKSAAAATRWLATGQIGSASGLGYQLPHLQVGIASETPIGTRWEAQGAFSWSPDHKYATHDGNEALIGGSGLLWATQSVALTGGARYGRTWTSQFNKSSWAPTAGVAFRESWLDFPGRIYVTYLFPTGCQWATASNPCRIQSNRISGVEGYQEMRVYSHLRVGWLWAWWHFADQANPNQPSAGRTWHNTGTASFVVRYEFRAGSLDERY